MESRKCKICGGERTIFDTAKIMGKYHIDYYRCKKCGLIDTEEPYWLDEAYSSAIADSDIGLLKRNMSLSILTSAIFKLLFEDAETFLDYGGGYGIYTRMMRDKGFDFQWYDAYSENLFAKGHEKDSDSYDVITAFELMEHVYYPCDILEKIFSMCNTFIFTTGLNSFSDPHKVDDWWYYCTDHGQHISIYTIESLNALAEIFNKRYFNCGEVHIITDKPLNKTKLKLCRKFAPRIDRIIDRPSLLNDDYLHITGKKLLD